MSIYIYQNEETGEVKEIVQRMDEPHTYSEEGVEWKRVFTVPNAQISAAVDPFNPQQFVEKTGNSKGSLGDVFDRAKELSDQRKAKIGYDPVQNKYFDSWSEKRAGKRHPADSRPIKPEKLKVAVSKKEK